MEIHNREAAKDRMRSIGDAEKQCVPPVSQSQKQSVPLTSGVERWLTKEIHILPDKWRLSNRVKQIVAALFIGGFAVYVIAAILIEFMPPLWMQIATGVFFLLNLLWKFKLSGDSASDTNFDRFCDSADNTLWFVIGIGLLWDLSTYTPGWIWVAIGLFLILVVALALVFDVLLFIVRCLGRAWRNE